MSGTVAAATNAQQILQAAQAAQAGTSTKGYNTVGDSLVQFSSGLNTNTDPFVLQPPFVTTAQDIFFLSPGQVQALPLVAQSPLDMSSVSTQTAPTGIANTYTSGPLPTLEPHGKGSIYEIAEVGRTDRTGTSNPHLSPYMLVRDMNGNDPKGPTAPIYPYNTATRTMVGNINSYADQQVGSIGTQMPLLTPVATSSKLDPTRVLVAMLGALGSETGSASYCYLYLNDTTGSTIAQLGLNIATGGYANIPNIRLISDQRPSYAGYHYLIVSVNATIQVYTLKVPLSTDVSTTTAITLVTTSSITPFVTGACDTAYIGLIPCLYYISSPTTIQVIMLQPPGGPTPLNPVYAVTISGSTPNTLVVDTTVSLNSNATASEFVTVIAAGIQIACVTCLSTGAQTGTTTYLTIPSIPQTIIVRPNSLTNLTNYYGCVFGYHTETFNALSGQGWPTSNNTQYVQQIVATYFSAPTGTPTIEVSTPFRTMQGSVIVGKAFTFNSIDNGNTFVGNQTESFCCPILTGAYTFDQTSTGSQAYFVIDHFARVVSRFNELTTPQYVYTTSTTGFFTVNTGLSAPIWLSNPNNASQWEVGFPYAVPILLALEGFPLAQAQASLAAGTQVVPQYDLASSGGYINFFFMSQQAQGAVPQAVQKGKSIHLSGGLSMEYDTRTLHESGFHLPPLPPGPAAYGATGTTFPAGEVFPIYVVHTWTDATGSRHVSPASLARYVASQSTGNTSLTYFVPSPIATYKNTYAPIASGIVSVNLTEVPVTAEIYRTVGGTAANSVAYYMTSINVPNMTNGPISGNLTDFGIILTDNFADNYVTGATAATPPAAGLYLSVLGVQNEYESDGPPPFIYQINSQGRAFGLACVNGAYRVYFTSVFTDNNNFTQVAEAPRWNYTGYLNAPAELGDCRSLGVLYGNIFVFGTRGIGVFSGNGPSLSLASNEIQFTPNSNDYNFSQIVPIPIPCGVVGSGSPLTIPNGIVYQDRQGMMLMTSGLTTQFIGKMITEVTAAALYGTPTILPNLQIAVWPNANGQSLVMDYNNLLWSQWACVGNCMSMYYRSDGTGFVASGTLSGTSLTASGTSQIYPSGTTTPVTPIAASAPIIETPWLNIGQGFSGEGDLWDMILLGKYLQPHTLTVQTAFNYGPYTQTTVYQPGTDPTVPTLPYQYRFRPLTGARMQTVRYKITITPTISTGAVSVECARLTGLMMNLGNYRGLNRVGAVASR